MAEKLVEGSAGTNGIKTVTVIKAKAQTKQYH